MVDNVVDSGAQSQSIEPGECRRNTHQSRSRWLCPFLRVQSKVLENHEVAWCDNMMCFVYKNQLESIRIVSRDAIVGDETSNRSNSNVCCAGRFYISHLDVDALAWIGSLTVSRCLLDQLPPMSEYESLLRIFGWRLHSIDELGKDDLRPSAGAYEITSSEPYCLATSRSE